MKRQNSIKQVRDLLLVRGNYYFIRSVQYNQYLTVNKSQKYEKQNIFLSELNKIDLCQVWMIQQIQEGIFQIVHPFSCCVFELVGDQIKLKTDKLKNSQTFYVQKSISQIQNYQSNVFTIKEFKRSKKYVTWQQNQLKSVQIKQQQNLNHRWKFQLAKDHHLIQQTFIIQNLRSGLVLQVLEGSQQQEQNIIQNQLTKRFNQRWHIVKSSDFYLIKCLKSGLVLDIKSQKDKQGINVVQNKFKDSLSQKWVLECHGKRIFIIRSAMNKYLMLAIKGCSIRNQAQLIITKNQVDAFWRIVGPSVI